MGVTPPSAWPWLDRLVSGLYQRLIALFRLAFAAPPPIGLSLLVRYKSLTHNTKGTLSPLRAPTVCRHSVSGALSLPLSGCFSPFPHGTSSLSVAEEYLGLEGGPPMFRQDCTCPALLESRLCFLPVRGYHPLRPGFPSGSSSYTWHWPDPRSLATTSGVSVDVLSSRYLDVSVPWVCSSTL